MKLSNCKKNIMGTVSFDAAYHRKWRADNPEKVKAAQAKYRAAHSELVKARCRASRKKHRAKFEIYRKQNADYFIQKDIEWRAKNKSKISAYLKSYHAANPEKARFHFYKRRALKARASVGDRSAIIAWEKSWRKSPSVACHWCGNTFTGKQCHSDHLKPLSKGGAHCVSNLCISCSACNLKKGARQWIKSTGGLLVGESIVKSDNTGAIAL